MRALGATLPQDKDFRKVRPEVVAESGTRLVGLRQYLAAMALFCVMPNGNPECTFLPSEAVAFLKVVPSEKNGDPGEFTTLTPCIQKGYHS